MSVLLKKMLLGVLALLTIFIWGPIAIAYGLGELALDILKKKEE